MAHVDELRDALLRISEIAAQAAGTLEETGDEDSGSELTDGGDVGVCVPRRLPKRLLRKAAQVAIDENPMNGLTFGAMVDTSLDSSAVLDPARIAVLIGKYWGPSQRRLSVSFMESTPSSLQQRIVSHMNAWQATCGISFAITNGVGDIRISRAGSGYWSYLGTDVLLIPRNRPTMNLQGFTMNTPESEYRRVVRHETGHTLGFPHEHMRRQLIARLDRRKTYDYFLRTQGWDQAMVDSQVLTPLNDASIYGTPADQTSIMCYQLPGSITKDGQPIVGGADINRTDAAFAARIYPRANAAPAAGSALDDQDTWDEDEDVDPPSAQVSRRR